MQNIFKPFIQVSSMKFPKQVMRYCPYCKKRVSQKVSQAKTKPRPKTKKHALKWGIRQMSRITSGYGGFPRSKADKVKQSQHTTLKYTCQECKKSTIRAFGRMKKFSQV